jgi:hypothetical protein
VIAAVSARWVRGTAAATRDAAAAAATSAASAERANALVQEQMAEEDRRRVLAELTDDLDVTLLPPDAHDAPGVFDVLVANDWRADLDAVTVEATRRLPFAGDVQLGRDPVYVLELGQQPVPRGQVRRFGHYRTVSGLPEQRTVRLTLLCEIRGQTWPVRTTVPVPESAASD